MTGAIFSLRGSTEPGFVVDLEGFNGPLDLLLHLVREEKIDLADIPIARVADQFLAAIHALGLNQAADYLEMAGRLLRLKAQLLLPRHGDDEAWEDPRAELVRRLLEYQQIKEISLWLGAAADRRALRHVRGWLPPPGNAPPPPPLTLALADLLLAVERVVTAIPEPMLHSVIARPLNVEAAFARIEALFATRDSFDWREALGERPTLTDVLSTLLALLELARRGVCRIRQEIPFAPMVISRELAEPAVAAS